MKKDKPTSFRPRPEMLEKIDSICEKLGCSRNDYINTVLEYAIIEDKKEQESNPKDSKPKEEKPQKIIFDELPDVKPQRIVFD